VAELGGRAKTVYRHRTTLMRKLSLHVFSGLTWFALEIRLIHPKENF
jgi:DNA-binding CsgD family transcriptional regulator